MESESVNGKRRIHHLNLSKELEIVQPETTDLGKTSDSTKVAANAEKNQTKGPSRLAATAKLLMKVITTPIAAAAAVGGGALAAGAAAFVFIPASVGATIGMGMGAVIDKLTGNKDSKAAKAGTALGGTALGGFSAAVFSPIVALGVLGAAAAMAGGTHIWANVMDKVDLGVFLQNAVQKKPIDELVQKVALDALAKNPNMKDEELLEKLKKKFRGYQFSVNIPEVRKMAAKNAIFQGGHAGAFVEKEGGFLEKKTTKSEVEMYDRITREEEYAPLKEITAEVRNLNSDNMTVEMKNLTDGFKLNENNKIAGDIIDIKLGRSTYSSAVDQLRKGKRDLFKRITMGIVDAITDRSFKVTKGKGALERRENARASDRIILDIVKKHPELHEQLLNDLENIRKKMEEAPVAFFGHSVLIVMGQDPDGNPKLNVKLIDIGNHVTKNEAADSDIGSEFDKLRRNNTEALDDLLTLLRWPE